MNIVFGSAFRNASAQIGRYFDQVERFAGFFHCLFFRGTDNMSISETECTNALKTHKFARLFVSIKLREFGDA